jgi:hypothetical protein
MVDKKSKHVGRRRSRKLQKNLGKVRKTKKVMRGGVGGVRDDIYIFTDNALHAGVLNGINGARKVYGQEITKAEKETLKDKFENKTLTPKDYNTIESLILANRYDVIDTMNIKDEEYIKPIVHRFDPNKRGMFKVRIQDDLALSQLFEYLKDFMIKKNLETPNANIEL